MKDVKAYEYESRTSTIVIESFCKEGFDKVVRERIEDGYDVISQSCIDLGRGTEWFAEMYKDLGLVRVIKAGIISPN